MSLPPIAIDIQNSCTGEMHWLSHYQRTFRCNLEAMASWNIAKMLLLDEAVERIANGLEGIVDVARKSGHTRSCTKSYQSDNQSILNEILTFFAAQQILDLDRQQHKFVLHFYFLLDQGRNSSLWLIHK
jgi:hypothetical protein